ncbi:reverse transcriptase [Cucumis melo var. makuwa]|uniref:Reverse transcriptase n=1 Tax=Cucumis melo var. makuwa TaxID=1194695 RepID=A0A5D3BEZ4_CUCMM|nr:reverse transcriptase [Cucumis melo var. makuwa]
MCVLEKYHDVMPDSFPKSLPPRRMIDREIELMLEAKLPAKNAYRMAPSELAKLRKQLDELLNAWFIKSAKASFRASVVFQKKNDGSLRLCIDYRALNKLMSGYYQVRITEGDEPKTTCVTRYEAFKFLVIPFGLTNAPYNLLYIDEPEYGRIGMEVGNIAAICNWKVPKSVSELHSFLGLANYYRRFVEGFSKRASPLTKLLIKDVQWSWDPECQVAFDGLKQAMREGPLLGIADVTKPFVVETNASNYALEGVLL